MKKPDTAEVFQRPDADTGCKGNGNIPGSGQQNRKADSAETEGKIS